MKLLCDHVFGEENFVALFPWRKRTAKSDVPFGVSKDYEWIVSYARTDSFWLVSMEREENITKQKISRTTLESA